MIFPFYILHIFKIQLSTQGVVASAGLATFTAIPQLILALQSDSKFDIQTSLTNFGVDVAGLFIGAFLLSKEISSEQSDIDNFAVEEKIVSYKLDANEIAERENLLSLLPVQIQISDSDVNATRIVSLGDLQSKGNQNIVIVFGSNSYVKDAVLSARIEGTELFFQKDTIVVPIIFEDDQIALEFEKGIKKKGFGGEKKKEDIMTAAYIAKIAQVTMSFLCFLLAILACTKYCISPCGQCTFI